MATKGHPGCFTLIVGAGVLWALPGAIWDAITRDRAIPGVEERQELVPGVLVAQERPGEILTVPEAVLSTGAIPGPSVSFEEDRGVREYQEEVKRRVRESAPWF